MMNARSLLTNAGILFILVSCSKNDNSAPQTIQFQVSTNSINLSGNKGGVDSFYLQSDVSWTLSISPSNINWIITDLTSGFGDALVHIEIAEDNQTGSARTGVITVTPAPGSGKQPLLITVTQQTYQPEFNTIWNKLFGGTGEDGFYSVIPGNDGGYILAGSATSADGDLTTNQGDHDLWVLKIDDEGNKLWQYSYGGSAYERAFSVISTGDGGYALAGSSQSLDGDVTGNHGAGDIWVIKLDMNGTLQWQKTFGGTKADYATTIVNTTDGGYLVQGNTMSSDGDVSSLHGHLFDIWLLKLDDAGNLVWEKTYGGSNLDVSMNLLYLNDGTCLVSGYTFSNDFDVTANKGGQDLWLIKISADGNIIWQRTFGGTGNEAGKRIAHLITGDGFLIAGETTSNDGEVSGNHGGTDFWALKVDDNGNLLWQKTYGGGGDEFLTSITVNNDGSYLLSGSSKSADGEVTGHLGEQDAWIVKADVAGTLLWQKSIGGTADDVANALYTNGDGSFLLVGSTWSNDNDVTGNHGQEDAWVIRFSD